MQDRLRAEFERHGYTIEEARTDLAIGDLNAYFGGVHAIAYEEGTWRGARDPRRDGEVKYAFAQQKLERDSEF
jgi:gamma-glutamyltranspeptidase/glutathione hydrolase